MISASMEKLEALPDYWRGRARIRVEMMHPDEPQHSKLALDYMERAYRLELKQYDR